MNTEKKFEEVKIGDVFHTPRFLTVRIDAIFDSERDSWPAKFREPTHFIGPDWIIVGKSVDEHHMRFAALHTGGH